MYRCQDCGKEYTKQVEYCDCGNNTFDFIQEKPQHVEKKAKEPLTLEQKSQIISIVFFVLCLVLSLIVWLIPVKTAHEEVKIKEEKPVKVSIPDIDKFWDSTPVKVAEKVPPAEPVFQNEPIPLNVIPYDNKINQPKKTQTNVSKPSAQPKKEDKKVVKTQPAQNVKPVQNPKSQNVKPKEQPKPAQNTKPQNVTQQQPKQQAVQPVQQQKKEEIKVETPKKVYNPNSPEMLKYKGELRAVLFRKLPIGSVQGSGNCSVHFSIDSTGKLVNRGFTKLSDNKSLNDAVYYMLMSVPKYNVPPEGYSGEMINMNFSVNNGNYEITIK